MYIVKVYVQLENIDRLLWNKEYGSKLRKLRQSKSITRKQLGLVTEISYALLEKVEMGLVETISKDSLLLIVNALDISISELYPTIEVKI